MTFGKTAGGGEASPQTHEAEPFLRGIIEAVVLLLVVRAAEPLFFGEGYYSALTVHPFWIVVILASVQSGLFVGITTAAMASMLMEGPPRAVGVDITAYYVGRAVLPVQWLIAAIIIGSFRQGQIRRQARLLKENERLQIMAGDLAAEIERMDGDIAEIEVKAATANGIIAQGGGKSAATVEYAILAPLYQLLTTSEGFSAHLEAASGAMGFNGVRFWPADGVPIEVGSEFPFEGSELDRLRLAAMEGGSVLTSGAPVRVAGVGGKDWGVLLGAFLSSEAQDDTVSETDSATGGPLWRISVLATTILHNPELSRDIAAGLGDRLT